MRASPGFLAFTLLSVLVGSIPTRAVGAQYTIGTFNQQGNDRGGSASEPSIAVGPFDVFAQQQGDINFYDKSGASTYAPDCPHLFYETLGNSCSSPSYFFDSSCNGTCLGGGAGDPSVAYDPIAQRYYAVCMTHWSGVGATSHIHLAVSRSNRLSDGWYLYHVRTSEPAGCPTTTDIDHPVLGFSSDKIVVYAQFCPIVRVFDKAALLNGAVTYQQHAFPNATTAFHNDLSPSYYVDVVTTSVPGSGARVCRNLSSDPNVYIVSLGGTTASITSISGAFPAVSTTTYSGTINALHNPVDAPQKNGSPLLASWGGVLLSDPVCRFGVISLAWHEYTSAYAANAIRVLQLNALTAQPMTQLTYGASGVHYCYPAVTQDASGNLYLGFDASNSSMYPSCYITGLKFGDANFESPPTLIKAGTAAYTLTDGRGAPCWGDFTGIALDETVSPPVAYYEGQYTTSATSMASWVTSFFYASSVTGGTGGGCPWVELKTSAGWSRENTILHRSAAHAIARDGYRLVGRPSVENGRVTIRITEDEQEQSTIDQLSIATVDRAQDEATALLDGHFYSGHLGQPWSLQTLGGQRVAVAQGTAYRGSAGSGVLAVDPSDASTGGIQKPIVIRPFIKQHGLSPAPVGVDGQTNMDAWIESHTGIRVEGQTSSGDWQQTAVVYPREKESEQWLAGSASVRLTFIGNHAVQSIQPLDDAREVASADLRLVAASHSRLGDVLEALRTKDGTTVDVRPGDVLTLEFEAPPEAAADRDYYLLSDGYYTSVESSSGLSSAAPGVTTPTIRGIRPNPFSHTTSIAYALPKRTTVKMEILDASGRMVRTVVNGEVGPGEQAATWDGKNDSGKAMAAGVYFAQLRADGTTRKARLVLLAN